MAMFGRSKGNPKVVAVIVAFLGLTLSGIFVNLLRSLDELGQFGFRDRCKKPASAGRYRTVALAVIPYLDAHK